MARMIMGVFNDPDHADQAIMELEKLGIDPADISLITKETDEIRNRRGPTSATNMAEDAVEGAAAGAVTGGALGGLAGLLAGVGVFPALAGLFIGGPVAAALGLTGAAAVTASGAATGAAAGGLIGALTNLGVPDETAESYSQSVEEGGLVLGIPIDMAPEDEVRRVMEDHGATDLYVVQA